MLQVQMLFGIKWLFRGLAITLLAIFLNPMRMSAQNTMSTIWQGVLHNTAGTPLHGAVLKQRGVAHLFNSWTEMPSIGEQLELPWVWSAPFTVTRALLRPGRSYQHAVTQFQPYDRVQEAQPEVRRDLLRLIRGAMSRAAPGLIVVNNRLEGNAPGTIRALAQMIAADP